ncbi:MAG TPA: GLPGLI family protein [Chitinophaga sp.]|uniref:GLPGLI family protein n=1 Tax=Chitinophaga sp. TaxID=1869181 RepID=UPI002C1F9661|nr:GLPGLI family protein [Chitinophaga sp.]HVI48912.1 GLPGLI family protein [Chitinophaga sp.]
MNRLFRYLCITASMLPFTQRLLAQQSGVIEYEVTAKTDPERMRSFQRGGDDAPPIPDIITFKSTFTFNATNGKLTVERPNFGGDRRPPRDSSAQGGRRMGFRGNNGEYIDLANKKYQQVFSTFGEDKKTYYTEEDYIIATDSKPSDKTKKIAGFTCKKATVQLKDDTYTVWYTTDLPFSFSPINGLLPVNNAVVLGAEGGKRSYTATSVSLKPIADEGLVLPAGAEKISQEQMREVRRQEMEKLRKRQQ